MTDYYEQKVHQDIHSLDDIQVGDVVVARYGCDGSWYRARVIQILNDDYDPDNSLVDVDFVDFGDCDKRQKAEIMEIRTDFLKLSFQAIPCTMANIKPK